MKIKTFSLKEKKKKKERKRKNYEKKERKRKNLRISEFKLNELIYLIESDMYLCCTYSIRYIFYNDPYNVTNANIFSRNIVELICSYFSL